MADVDEREKKVRGIGIDGMAKAVEDSRKCYLFRGRREPSKDGKSSVRKACLRHYLTQVSVPRHRRMLTRLLADDLRPSSFSRMGSSEPQLCAHCAHVDTIEHALFQCWGSVEVILWRAEFFHQVQEFGIIAPAVVDDDIAVTLVQSSLSHWDAVRALASFVYKTCMHLKKPEGM